MRRFIVVFALLFVVACSSRRGATTGTWSGVGMLFDLDLVERRANVTPLTFSLTLVEDAAGSITGAGVCAPVSCQIIGTHVAPTVSFTIRSPGREDANFTGTMTTTDTIVGNLNGSGFTGTPVTFSRQVR